MNIKELMQRREQINEDINNVFLVITSLKKTLIKCLDNNDFDSVQLVSNHLCESDQQIKIMLEQNVTLKEARAIIAAQSEEPAAAEPKQEEPKQEEPKQEEPKQEEPEQFAGLNLTEKETATLNALIKGLYAEVGFSDVTDTDLVNETGIPAKSMRGVLSSLSKKGIIQVDTETVKELKIDHRHVDWNSFIYLQEEFYGLHPRWAAEIAENA